jgi:hypothetical protein
MTKISCGEAHRARHASIAEEDFTSRLFFDGRKQYGDNAVGQRIAKRCGSTDNGRVGKQRSDALERNHATELRHVRGIFGQLCNAAQQNGVGLRMWHYMFWCHIGPTLCSNGIARCLIPLGREFVAGLLDLKVQSETRATRRFKDSENIGFLAATSLTPTFLSEMRSPPSQRCSTSQCAHFVAQEASPLCEIEEPGLAENPGTKFRVAFQRVREWLSIRELE